MEGMGSDFSFISTVGEILLTCSYVTYDLPDIDYIKTSSQAQTFRRHAAALYEEVNRNFYGNRTHSIKTDTDVSGFHLYIQIDD